MRPVPVTLAMASSVDDWDIDGDGVYGEASGPTVQFTYSAAGSYPVGLRVTDADGATGTASTTVTVNDVPAPTLDDSDLVAHWTFDGTTADAMRGYLDGQLFGSGAGSQLWKHSGDVGIGAMDDATVFHDGNAGGDGHGFAGKVDDVRIYARVFAAAELDELWSLT